MRARQVAGFGLRSALVYGLLIAPWPGLIEAYGSFYRVMVQIATISADPERSVVVSRYRPNRRLAATVMDTQILHRIPDTAGFAQDVALQSIRSSRSTGYMPTALVMALILATPIPWRRRASALGIAVLLMTTFVATMPAFPIYEAFEPERRHFLIVQLPWLEAPWRAALHALTRYSFMMGPYYVVPPLLWLLLLFKREDWLPLAERLAAGARSPR
jgi:hypothetical protein